MKNLPIPTSRSDQFIVVDNKRYELKSKPCDCQCHKVRGINHFRSCCEGGVKFYYELALYQKFEFPKKKNR